MAFWVLPKKTNFSAKEKRTSAGTFDNYKNKRAAETFSTA
jgi:hypothetical protein